MASTPILTSATTTMAASRRQSDTLSTARSPTVTAATALVLSLLLTLAHLPQQTTASATNRTLVASTPSQAQFSKLIASLGAKLTEPQLARSQLRRQAQYQSRAIDDTSARLPTSLLLGSTVTSSSHLLGASHKKLLASSHTLAPAASAVGSAYNQFHLTNSVNSPHNGSYLVLVDLWCT